MNDMREKICKKCQKVKPVDDFYENKYSPDGRYAFCKVCFDQFEQRLKEKERSSTPLNKTCEKCGKVRLIDEFDKHPDKPDTEDNWCRRCRQAYNNFKKQQAEKNKNAKAPDLSAPKSKKPAPPELPEKESKGDKPVSERVEKPPRVSVSEPLRKAGPAPPEKPTRQQTQKPEPAPAPEPIQGLDDDFDFIEYLLEKQFLEKKYTLEKLQIPRQITKIKARKRICNGCGKIEEIDQVEKNTVIPVHAWFCDFCRQKNAKRRVRKGIIVQDYWGREFKIKKISGSDLVMGVLKNKNGKWGKKNLKIYGNWETR